MRRSLHKRYTRALSLLTSMALCSLHLVDTEMLFHAVAPVSALRYCVAACLWGCELLVRSCVTARTVSSVVGHAMQSTFTTKSGRISLVMDRCAEKYHSVRYTLSAHNQGWVPS